MDVTLASLSLGFGFGMAFMTDCFKSIFGMLVNLFQKIG